MDRLKDINRLKSILMNEKVLSEDEELVSAELYNGIEEKKLIEFENYHKITIPFTLRNILTFSNGMDLYGLQLLSLEEMEYFPNECLLSFHSWGNGDFDCVKVSDEPFEESVWFMNHSQYNTFKIIDSLLNWFFIVVDELKSIGTLLHPMDYSHDCQFNGLYKKISEHLNNA